MPLLGMQLGPGSPNGLPQVDAGDAGAGSSSSTAARRNALDPTTIVVDAGKAHQRAATAAAMARLTTLAPP